MTCGSMIVTEPLTKISCGNCGGVYAIGERYRQECAEYARCWHCPYCKREWGYPGKTEAERQRERAKRERDRADRAEALVRDVKARHRTTTLSLNATKGVLTRTKNRVKNGVCPCCNRSFVNLQRHMKSEHPRYIKGK